MGSAHVLSSGCVQMCSAAGTAAQLPELLLTAIICRPCRGSCAGQRCREEELSVPWCVSSRELRQLQIPKSECADGSSTLTALVCKQGPHKLQKLRFQEAAQHWTHIKEFDPRSFTKLYVWAQPRHVNKDPSSPTLKNFHVGSFCSFLTPLICWERTEALHSQHPSACICLYSWWIYFLKFHSVRTGNKRKHSKMKEAKRKWKKKIYRLFSYGVGVHDLQ